MRIGRWRCPAENPIFYDSGPIAGALFAFPREGVWIEHEGRDPFVADANTVTYYNQGQIYTRRKLSRRGDMCEWFEVDPAIIAEVLSANDPSANDRPQSPFTFTHGPSDADSYLRQRIVFNHVSREQNPDRLFVEEAVLSILGDVTTLAFERSGAEVNRTRKRRRDVDVVEAARDLIARRFTENMSLADIAALAESSEFHLARMFKARTGLPLHAYRNQLRLRSALDRLRRAETDLTGLALDLGFSSHSHFTATFRRTFGKTPSAIRKSL